MGCLNKFTEEQYTKMLVNLFPTGAAFPREIGNTFYNFMNAHAPELFRLDGRISKLFWETVLNSECNGVTFPDELLPEWEKDFGFPDNCFDIPAAVSDRIEQLLYRVIFPLTIETGYVSTGNTTKDSNIITGVADTTDIYVGDLVHLSTGYFDQGKYEVLEKTASTLTLESEAFRTKTGATLTGYFLRQEHSERFFKALVKYLDSSLTVTSITSGGGAFLCGVSVCGDPIGDALVYESVFNITPVPSAEAQARIECIINTLFHSHMTATFIYS